MSAVADTIELRQTRAAHVVEARQILESAKDEGRDLSAEEQQTYERWMDAADDLKGRIDREERMLSAVADLDAPLPRVGSPLDAEMREVRGNAGWDGAALAEYRSWMQTGSVGQRMRGDQGRLAELRDTITGTDAKGGYLIAPVKVSGDLVKQVDNECFIRKLATVTRVTEAKKLGIRKMSTRMADADWTTEVGPVTEDTTMAFDRRDLEPYLLSKLAKMSIRTMYLASDAEQIIRDELAYQFASSQEKAFLTGNGSSKPLGLFTASSSGISTGRDVVAGTATALTADGLIDAMYNLKAGYQRDPSSGWIFHRDGIKQIRKLKDSTGQYLWAPGLTGGQPDRILDRPLYMSEYAPNTFTANSYVGLFGCFRYYRIAEVADLVLQRLVELFAATSEIGFIGRVWVDGAPMLEEAFARLKLAAS